LHADVEQHASGGGITSHVMGINTVEAEILEAEPYDLGSGLTGVPLPPPFQANPKS
jgi:hypothetical protein